MPIRGHALALAAGLLAGAAVGLPAGAEPARDAQAQANERLVRQAFDQWSRGNGTIFDLLHEQARWTIAGASPVSGVFHSRRELLDVSVAPISAKLAKPIVPLVRHIHADDDTVIVFWDGRATAKDGSAYDNSYAWRMQMRDGKIIDVLAFLDTWRLVELLKPQ